MTNKTAARITTKPNTQPSLPHRLDALLHSIRCIAQHEDELCTLLHDAKRNGKSSRALHNELRAILNQLPAEDYLVDLHALEAELEEPTSMGAAA